MRLDPPPNLKALLAALGARDERVALCGCDSVNLLPDLTLAVKRINVRFVLLLLLSLLAAPSTTQVGAVGCAPWSSLEAPEQTGTLKENAPALGADSISRLELDTREILVEEEDDDAPRDDALPTSVFKNWDEDAPTAAASRSRQNAVPRQYDFEPGLPRGPPMRLPT